MKAWRNALDNWRKGQSHLNHLIAWLLPMMAVLISLNIVARYLWPPYTILTYELILYLHIWVLFISFSYTWQEKAHIGIDIVAARLSDRRRAQINLCLNLALGLPFTVLLLVFGGQYAWTSWQILERSLETGGLDFVYLSKTAIPVGALLLLIQVLVNVVRELDFLRGRPRSHNHQTEN